MTQGVANGWDQSWQRGAIEIRRTPNDGSKSGAHKNDSESRASERMVLLVYRRRSAVNEAKRNFPAYLIKAFRAIIPPGSSNRFGVSVKVLKKSATLHHGVITRTHSFRVA